MRFSQPTLSRLLRSSALPATLGLILSAASAHSISPEPLPDPKIPNFAFPESEAKITRWITEMNRAESPAIAADAFEAIHRHGWGLWTALTTETAQSIDGQRLRVFETWLTPDEIDAPTTEQNKATASNSPRPTSPRRAPLRQLSLVPGRAEVRDSIDAIEPAAPAPAVSDRVLGFVKFDPTAAAHIAQQQLLHLAALNALLDGGAQQVPAFPATSLAVKPQFQIIRAKDLVAGRYYVLKAWPGPPSTPRPWGLAQWPGAVWIDVLGGGSGRGAVDPFGLPDGSTRTDDTTYPISSLLYYRLSSADATELNASKPGTEAAAGDFAILVAMHVSGREIARWTWQTFWWTPSPANPGVPSSAAIAQLRPEALRGAARNYAMALGYTMLSPEQPYVGGENAAPAVYVYNPWLEARLAAADLPDSRPGFDPDGRPAANNVGVQTNCMSCHAQANYNPHQRATAPQFTGARYVDLGAADFVGTLQVDFLWTLARHAR